MSFGDNYNIQMCREARNAYKNHYILREREIISYLLLVAGNE